LVDYPENPGPDPRSAVKPLPDRIGFRFPERFLCHI
jgi:hypothetical protein